MASVSGLQQALLWGHPVIPPLLPLKILLYWVGDVAQLVECLPTKSSVRRKSVGWHIPAIPALGRDLEAGGLEVQCHRGLGGVWDQPRPQETLSTNKQTLWALGMQHSSSRGLAQHFQGPVFDSQNWLRWNNFSKQTKKLNANNFKYLLKKESFHLFVCVYLFYIWLHDVWLEVRGQFVGASRNLLMN